MNEEKALHLRKLININLISKLQTAVSFESRKKRNLTQ